MLVFKTGNMCFILKRSLREDREQHHARQWDTVAGDVPKNTDDAVDTLFAIDLAGLSNTGASGLGLLD